MESPDFTASEWEQDKLEHHAFYWIFKRVAELNCPLLGRKLLRIFGTLSRQLGRLFLALRKGTRTAVLFVKPA